VEIQKLIADGQKDWAQCVATTICIWGMPIVACWKDRLEKMQGLSSDGEAKLFINEFRHQRSIANGSDDEFVNAGSDFLYSTAVIDLGRGPVTLQSGNFGKRWFGVQLLDPHMETVENFGTRRTGSQITRTVICGPSLEIQAASDTSAADPNRSEIDSQQYLDQFRQQTSVHCSEGLKFYQELAAVLCQVNPRTHEAMLGALLSQIGIHTGQPFDEKELPPAVVEGLVEAGRSAESILAAKFYEVGKQINGWGFVRDIGRYRDDYILRALVARHGIWANVPEESLYFIARTDATGNPLTGINTYRIQFEKEALPDVEAFWSLSYYDQNGRIPVDTDAPSFLNSGSDSLKYDSNGGVTVQVGPVAPRSSLNINWLPTLPQPFSLNLRCYQPTEAFRSGDVFVPPIVALDGA